MISQVRIDTKTNERGRAYDRATIWVAGIPFSADMNNDTMKRQLDRIAETFDCGPVMDFRVDPR